MRPGRDWEVHLGVPFGDLTPEEVEAFESDHELRPGVHGRRREGALEWKVEGHFTVLRLAELANAFGCLKL